jgi:hypothetical protein
VKCEACKYEAWDSDNKFIKIVRVATIKKKDRDDNTYDEKVDVLDCPKCGTLKISTDHLPYLNEDEEE